MMDLIISGVIDGPLTGGVPKAVEFYVLNDIADLSLYGFGSANNGGGSDGQEYTFTGLASAGEYIYIASDTAGFNSFFGFNPNDTASAANINGDDAIELFFNGSVVDVFGEIDVDGTGQPWEYLDGWTYRVSGTSPSNTFNVAEWTFSSPNALDGEASNSTAANPFPLSTFTTENDGGGGETVPIYDIQGAAQISPLLGESVTTTGIVTAVDNNGFYLQDPIGDGNDATSDAIFVFTSSVPGVSVGDELEVRGTVSEFTPGGTSTRNLSTTQISGNPNITTVSTGNPLPAAVIIGAAGRIPPSENIDDDAFASFDPATDGIDFFESLEGMRVTVQNLVAVAPTNRFGEIFGVADSGSDATGISERGTLNISPNDFNPEKIQIDEDTNVFDLDFFPEVNAGDPLGDVTGVVSYNFGNFEIIPTENLTPINQLIGLEPESTELLGNDSQLTIASYNVLNLDTNDEDGDTDVANGRFDAIARQIVNNLATPDIIGLQEIQDNSGSADDGITAADRTLQALIDAIDRVDDGLVNGTLVYEFIDNTFIGNNTSGGQPGGNIRTAFLYNPSRVSLVAGSVQGIGGQTSGETFNGARLPLVASFEFNNQEVTVVNNHFSSKGGSAPILGVEQDFAARQEDISVNGSLDERREQAQAVNNFVDGVLANDINSNVVVLGDLNEFEFVSPLQILEGTTESSNGGQDTVAGGAAVLTNLINDIPEDERYSFIFQGNSQELDHILVSDSLVNTAEVDIVHTNAEFNETSERASDHDPIVSRFTFEQPSVGKRIIGTFRRDFLIGTEGDDTIKGFAGRDYINGAAGDDLIIGGRGSDRLRGGRGNDTFIYKSTLDRRDRIKDFEVGSDKLDFTDIFELFRYGSATPIDDYVRVVQQGENAAVQIDLNGDFGFFDRFRTFALLENTVASSVTSDSFV